MMRFVLRRLAVAVPTLLCVITVAFFMMRIAPGSPFDSDRKLSAEIQRNLEARYGMDQPLMVQYLVYVSGVLRGDLGPSLKYRDKDVRDFIREGLPASAAIGGAALLIALIVGMGLGIIAALRRNTAVDQAATAVAIFGVCIPAFATAPLLVLVFASTLGWLPTAGTSEGVRSYVLPVVVLALPHIAMISRLTRVGLIDVLRSNYIRTARSKGLPERTILFKYALRGAVLPLVSYMGPGCAGLITGSLVVEKSFGLPGLGGAFVLGALHRDYTLVMGVVILYAALILLMNLLADMLSAYLDPRTRLA